MELKFVKAKKCPICGCDIVVKEYVETDIEGKNINVHTNGGLWEHRVFLCGADMEYIPNFLRESLGGQCRNDSVYLENLRKEKEDKEKLLDFCKKNNISPFKYLSMYY